MIDIAKITSLVDLTTLSGVETDADIRALLEKQTVGSARVAAICVYPQFVPTVRGLLSTDLPIAAVANFPSGSDDLDAGERSVVACLEVGANEIDYVIPYRAALAGNWQLVETALARVIALSKGTHMKVIIESGELKTPENIERASRIAIDAGANFIKTSTGKVAVNATLEAAEIMVQAIKDSGADVGFKPAGGIKTAEQAQAYIDSAEAIMGAGWVRAERYRIGASSIIDDLRARL